MLDVFGSAAPLLPTWLLEANLLRAFLWYISLLFLVSLGLRVRFYHSVYEIAQHVRYSCPRIFSLIHEHWFLCLKDGLITWVGLYLALLVPYSILNNFVWPRARVSFLDLAALSPEYLAFVLVLGGLMLTLDGLLIAQVSVIDAARIKSDLTWSEEWLAGSLYRFLDYLGRWNPIKLYADALTLENIRWLNRVFRTGLWSMMLQLGLRLSVAAMLYACFLLHPA